MADDRHCAWIEARDGMSFREKSSWVSLILLLAVYGIYFWRLSAAALRGPVDKPGFVGLLIGTFIVLTALQIVFQIVLAVVTAIRAPNDVRRALDEREKVIALKARSGAYGVLTAGVFLAAGTLFFDAGPFVIWNAILLAGVLAQAWEHGATIALFRRGD